MFLIVKFINHIKKLHMKKLLAIMSIIIALNTSNAQTKKPILNNSFPNHITKFSSITKDSINIRYKRLHNFTFFKLYLHQIIRKVNSKWKKEIFQNLLNIIIGILMLQL